MLTAEHPTPTESSVVAPWWRAALEVLLVAARLGITSFGGPIAHLGYFRDEYVARRRWLDDRTYTDLVVLHSVRNTCEWRSASASGTRRVRLPKR